MKQRIFIYLFIFAILLIIFQYVNSKNIFENQKTRIESLEKQLIAYKDSIKILEDKIFDYSYFLLEENDDAQTVIEEKGFKISKFVPLIKEELIKLNDYKDEHPLVPHASMTSGKILINNIRILNHQWVITNFSDGKYWGEMLIEYTIAENKDITFSVLDSFIYPLD